MNKKVLWIMAAILIAIGGGMVFLLSSTADKTAKQEMIGSEAQAPNQVARTDQEAANNQSGVYIDYSQSVIVDTAGSKLLFFHAPWCPQCRALEADIKQKGVPDGVAFIKIDYDTNQQLRQKYGVTIQTTIVRVDDNGNLIKKYVAYDEPTIDSVIKNLL